MQMGGSNMERDSYVYKTPASKLVQVAAIAAEYKDRPDMLMTVLIRAQKVVPAFSKAVASVIAKDRHPDEPGLQLCNLYRDAFGETSGQIHCPACAKRPVPCPRREGDREAIEDQLGISIGETTEDGRFTLEYCPCLGLCEISPAIMINDRAYGNLTPESVREIIKQYIRRMCRSCRKFMYS